MECRRNLFFKKIKLTSGDGCFRKFARSVNRLNVCLLSGLALLRLVGIYVSCFRLIALLGL